VSVQHHRETVSGIPSTIRDCFIFYAAFSFLGPQRDGTYQLTANNVVIGARKEVDKPYRPFGSGEGVVIDFIVWEAIVTWREEKINFDCRLGIASGHTAGRRGSRFTSVGIRQLNGMDLRLLPRECASERISGTLFKYSAGDFEHSLSNRTLS
jgi:hypothetical protein